MGGNSGSANESSEIDCQASSSIFTSILLGSSTTASSGTVGRLAAARTGSLLRSIGRGSSAASIERCSELVDVGGWCGLHIDTVDSRCLIRRVFALGESANGEETVNIWVQVSFLK